MKRRILVTAMAVATLTAALASAQWTNQKKSKPRDPTIRNVQGVVTLPDGAPVEAAVVKLKNLKSLQIRSYFTQTDGKYQFHNLSTSVDYELIAEWKDHASSKRTLSVFDNRLDAIMHLRLEPVSKASAEKQESKPTEEK
jgi:hypothetical protein